MVIGMAFTIGIPNISQWREFTGVDQELCKRGGGRKSGDFRPQYGLRNITSRVSGGRRPEAEAKCEIRVQFLTFSCTIFFDFMNSGAELGQNFCANTQFKKFRRCNWVEPPNRHSRYASGFRLVQTTRHPGRKQLR